MRIAAIRIIKIYSQNGERISLRKTYEIAYTSYLYYKSCEDTSVKIFDVNIENWYTLAITFNWAAIVLLFILALVISFIIKIISKHINKNSIEINGAEIGIGDSKISLVVNKKDQEIAYKIWVELSTRNIHDFDEDDDVIIEIYNSWYQLFGITRSLLEEIPASRIPYSKELIDLVNNMLNLGLRPHLSKWQAKYRSWYKSHIEDLEKMTPQEYQKEYPEYEALLKDVLATNSKMLSYKRYMYKIAFIK